MHQHHEGPQSENAQVYQFHIKKDDVNLEHSFGKNDIEFFSQAFFHALENSQTSKAEEHLKSIAILSLSKHLVFNQDYQTYPVNPTGFELIQEQGSDFSIRILVFQIKHEGSLFSLNTEKELVEDTMALKEVDTSRLTAFSETRVFLRSADELCIEHHLNENQYFSHINELEGSHCFSSLSEIQLPVFPESLETLLAEIKISPECFSTRIKPDVLNKSQIKQFVQLGELLLLKLSSLNSQDLSTDLVTPTSWGELPQWLHEHQAITKKMCLSCFSTWDTGLNEENLRLDQIYLMAIIAMVWAIYNRSALIQKDFERGSYTLVDENTSDLRLYRCLLEYVKLVNQTEDVFLQADAGRGPLSSVSNAGWFAFSGTQYAYCRNPEANLSSHLSWFTHDETMQPYFGSST